MKKYRKFFYVFLLLLVLVVPTNVTDISNKYEVNAEEITDSSKLSSLSFAGFENALTPVFSSDITNYTLSVTSNIIDLTPIYTTVSEGDNVNVTVTGNRYLINDSGDIRITVSNSEAENDTTYTIHYTKDLSGDPIGTIYTFPNINSYQLFEPTTRGLYHFELWGAQGGNGTDPGSSPAIGGKGAYTAGDMVLSPHEKLYIYVGGRGVTAGMPGRNQSIVASGGYNGGGNGSSYYPYPDYDYGAGAGGGATDIRYFGTDTVNSSDLEWNSSRGLNSRIMVAAGGGGASLSWYENGYSIYNGGYAGALIGGTGSSWGVNWTYGTGATQTAGGTGISSGTFGIGGNGPNGGAGGGAGYFGGGSSGPWGSAGGGSSYVSGHLGSVAIESENSTNPKQVSGLTCDSAILNLDCSIHYSGKQFTNTSIIDGNSEMPTYDGESTMVGNVNNGYAKVTLLEMPSDDNYLTSLAPTEGHFEETFDPTRTTYTLNISPYVSKFSLNGTTSDDKAVVTGLTEYSIDLGETKRINIIVVSESGNMQTYRVIATRSEAALVTSSTKLKSLTLTDGYELDFEPLKYTYDVNIAENAMEINISASTFDENARVTVLDNEYLTSNTGTVRVLVEKDGVESTTYTINYTKSIRDASLDAYTRVYNYTGDVQTFIAPSSSNYKISLWGGSGSNDAYGAYTEGKIDLVKDTELYIYVGNHSTGTANTKTFNGGTSDNGGYNGGSSTDVRYFNGNSWDDFNSLKTRIMVAAGGGSGDHPGAAGGLEGYNGQGSMGGSQTDVAVSDVTQSSFGVANGSCSGGNGYFPGDGSACETGSGGGSSYISGHPGVKSISEESTSDMILPTDNVNHYSGMYFTDTRMIDGKGYEWNSFGRGSLTGMPTFDGVGTMNGNNSTGRAVIEMTTISNDNYLSSITANIGTFDKTFDPTIYEYNLLIDKYESNVTLNAVASDSNSIIAGLGKVTLKSGETKRVTIVVTSPSGKTRNYIVNVKRDTLHEGEHNTKLYDLSIDGLNLDKPFASLEYSYNVEVSKNVYDLKVNAVPYDNAATITITGDKYLNSDYNVIKILVEYPGVESTTYNIYYTKIDYQAAEENFRYTGNYETFIAPYNATYKVELWGASGNGSVPGHGAYTSGKIQLSSGDIFYVYVGAHNTTASVDTFNASYAVSNNNYNSGGGATDIRLLPGNWDSFDSLKTRVMVAAGGGGFGSGRGTSTNYTAGSAGGLTGYASRTASGEETATSYGSTQVAGGNPGIWSPNPSGKRGTFGVAANGNIAQSNNRVGAGGGGGYFGGSSGPICSGNCSFSGSGGSSYISGHTGAVGIKEESTIDNIIFNTDQNDNQCNTGNTYGPCSYHYSGVVFDDTVMIDGKGYSWTNVVGTTVIGMPNYTATDMMTGNVGDGYAKISIIDVKSQNAYLEDLKVRKIDYTEENLVEMDFDPLVDEYNVTIDKYTRAFTVEGELSDENARVTGFGKYTIEPGEEKTIEITVTAIDGNTKTYTIHVTRENNTDHTTLLKNIQIDKYNLNEEFHSNKYNYTVDIFDVEIDLVVNALKFDNDATVTITGNRYISRDTGVITVTVKHTPVDDTPIEDTVYTITYTKIVPTMDTVTFNYKSEYQKWTTPFSAKYKIETWGAAGGGNAITAHTTSSSAGLGAYASGTFKILQGTDLYIYTGGKGTYGTNQPGGWNGGGKSGNAASGSGGGATDVRLTPTSEKTIWNEENSLYSRFIVAAGAGGSDDAGGTLNGSNDGTGGSGAGLIGQGAWIDGKYYESYGGTQSNGYALGEGAPVTASTGSGGAGGGYYGGIATNHGNGGGGAGSSYIKGYPGADTTYIEYQQDVRYVEGEFLTAQNNSDGYARISMLGIISDNVYLQELKVTTDLVSTSLINENYNPLQGNYTVTLDKYTELFHVTGILSDQTSTVVGLDDYTVGLGETREIPIVVTAESGKTKTYTITVTRANFNEGEHSSKLSSLTVDDFKLKENFYSEKYDYTMNVMSNEIDSNWHYTTYDPEATVVVSGDKYIKRSPGTITFTVSAPGCEDTVYVVTYTKVYTEEPSKNDYLASLESSNGVLSPEFDKLNKNYTINLDSTQSGTRLTGEVDDNGALVEGLDKYYTVDFGSSRVVDIKVTSDFGTERIYKVTINRAEYDNSPTTLLKSLVINGYETDIDFTSETFDYNLTLPKGEIDLNITAIPYDNTATVTIENNKHLVSTTGTITVTVTKEGLEDSVYTINYTKYNNYVEDYEYTGNYETFTAPYTGKYTIELWGASGGTSLDTNSLTGTNSKLGGAGGYTKGVITLEKGETIYIYVGSKGGNALKQADSQGGYNGGGNGTSDHADDESAGAGGGATDIRLLPGNWDFSKSLSSRIMVAAGGGGAAYNQPGGYAGGLVGEKAYYGSSANQVSGYSFGKGQDAVFVNTNVEVGGGGAGYYGGYAVSSGTKDVYKAAGGGGSSYISGYLGSVAIKSMTEIEPRLDANDEVCSIDTTDITCSYHYSGKIFTETEMLTGIQVQPSHDKTSYQTGNTGNGYAKISMELSKDAYLNELNADYGTFDLEFNPERLNYILTLGEYESYFNLTGKVSSPSATVTGLDRLYEVDLDEEKVIPIIVTAPNGNTKTYTITVMRDAYTDTHSTKLKSLNVVGYEKILNPKFIPIKTNYDIALDDAEAEVYVNYEAFDPTATVTVTGEGRVGESGILTVTVEADGVETTIYTISYVRNSTSTGTRFEYDYVGNYQTFIVPTTGYYDLEVWGAQGGGKNVNSSNGELGFGGAGGYSYGRVKLYKDTKLYVYVGGVGATSNDGIALGGFNGGGASFATSAADPASGGGGATDIRTEIDNLYTRFIVAGGGGGGGEDAEAGGAGGGTTGARVSSVCSSNSNATAGACGAVFGIGASTKYDGGGGGGGWYGGGTGGGSQDIPFENDGTDSNGGNGGSGFVLTNSTSSSTPTGYKLGSEWYLSDAKTLSGNEQMPSYDHADIKYGNIGNGYAVITLVSKTSKDNYLASLTSDYGTFNRNFNPETLTYTLNLDSYSPQFTLSGRPSDSEATVTGFGTYEIEPGESREIEIVVTATSGDSRTYKVNVVRQDFTDTHSTLLSKIELKEGRENTPIIIPSFNSNIFEYSIQVYSNVTDINVLTTSYDTDDKINVEVTGNRHLSSSGTILIKVTHEGLEDTIYRINYSKDKSLDDYIPDDDDVVTNYDYTGSYQTFITPSTGQYIIELWGASGNAPTNNRTYGGKGAYTYGILDLNKNDKLYIYVGQNRTDRTASWNAGSTGGSSSNTANGGAANGYGGGGATDVRLVATSAATTWNEAVSLKSRIMVAAGGGGAQNYSYPAYGGAAGGLVGYPGHNGKYPNQGVVNTPPTGGTQTNGGTTTVVPTGVTGYKGTVGSFGVGGNGHTSWGGAGGGGYYGGAGAGYSDSSVDSGAGGSSYISGYLGSVAIESDTSLAPRQDISGNVCNNGTTDITCSYHYSGKIFTNTKMLDGEQYLPTKDKTSLQFGNSGNGYARITQILKDKDNYLLTLTSTYGTFDKAFDPLIDEYTLTLDQYDTSFTLDGTLSQNDASVTGLGYYEIEDGEDLVIPIVVTAENGDAKTYTITAVRNSFVDEHSTKLKLLRLSDEEAINGRYGLNEEFNSLKYDYTTDLYSNVIDLTVNAVPYDRDANVEIINNLYLTEETGRIIVRVTAPETATTDYYIDYRKEIVPGAEIVQKYGYTGQYKTFTALVTGKYKVQLWGAAGGIARTDSSLSNMGGRGAYTEGIIKLDQGTNLYVYVGQKGYNGRDQGTYKGGNGGWNGGAKGGDDSNHDGAPDEGAGGGGATDIRLVPTSALTAWNERNSLVSRIMIAGGGSGSRYSAVGQPGGGWQFNNASYAWNFGYGRAGAAGTSGSSGGGGGYWGGNSQQSDGGIGYGGSSFISGHPGQIAITSPTDLSARLNSEGNVCALGTTDPVCSLHYSGYKFTDTVMKTGNEVMPNTAGTGTMTGNQAAGGYAIITPLFYSRDYYLSNITTTSTLGTVQTPEFDPLTDTYDVVMDKYDEWVTINATLSDPENSVVVGPGEYRLPEPGEDKTVELVVTAKSGETKTYYVRIHRNDIDTHTTKLKDLDVRGADDLIDPRFHSLNYEYDIVLTPGTINLTIDSLTYDDDAIVTITTLQDKNKVMDNDVYYVKDDTGTILVTVTLPDAYVDASNPETAPTTYVIRYDKYGQSGGAYGLNNSYYTWTAPTDGYYLVQLWGASGGYDRVDNKVTNRGGLGAYTEGKILVEKGTTFYIYVGGAGANAVKGGYAAGGYNGGGRGDYDHNDDDAAGGGGGATDIRTYVSADGAWNNFDSLKSRIMVAAGGAGKPAWWATNAGGGLYAYGAGSGAEATQTKGYAFGYGAPGTYRTSNTEEGGGGGGYYGGGVTSGTANRLSGGSSFISGHNGCDAIAEESVSGGIIHTGQPVHYTGHQFIETKMIDGYGYNWTTVRKGFVGQPTTSGTGTQTGQAGNGYAKITAMDRDNYLIDLTLSVSPEFATDTFDNVEDSKYSPEFDMFTTTYTLELPDHVTELTLGARPSSDKARVEGLGTFEVKAGTNIYEIKVTSESGEIKTYNVVVTRPASDEANALNITLTGFVESLCKPYESQHYCQLSPAGFDENTYDYYLSVPSGIRDLEWTVTKKHAYQTVIGDGVTRLGPLSNTITIEVTSESGEVKHEYTYHIFRDMTGDNYIDQLIINDPQIDLNFDYLLTEYSFRVDNQYTSLDMTVILDDPNASYEIIGNENFEVGANIVEIVVTAANGEKRSYVLNVYRLANGNKLLSELHVKNNGTELTLNPEFADIVTSYQLSVPNNITNVDISAVAAYNKTKISGIGKKTLKTGLNQINVVTTAENGETETYTIIINRAKSDNAYLSVLKALEGNFNETYVKTNNNYSITVNPYTKKLNLNIVPEEVNATYKVTGNENFKIGANTVKVTVTAENGKKNTYVITVTKQGSNINTLSSLTTNRGEVNPTFTPTQNNYSITVPNDISNITISGTMTDTLSKVTGFGTYRLTPGVNPIDITVTSETGVANIYTVTVLRQYNSNNYLSDLKVNGTTIKNFDKDTLEYEMNVANEIESVDILGIPEVNTTTVSGNGNLPLVEGVNTIYVIARAEDHSYRTYVITIIRDKSANANLEDLFIKESKIRPVFDPMTLSYTSKVMNDVTEIHVVATPKDPNATVTITGPVNSLQEGENEVKVTVVAPDGDTSKEYTIIVKRLPEFDEDGNPIPKLYLSDLDVSNCTLDFDKTTTYYECSVANEITDVIVNAEKEDDIATVTGTGNYELKVGKNLIQVVVSANIDDEDFERVYNVEIERLKSTESRLSNIEVKDHEFSPDFDKDTLSYDLTTNEYDLEFTYVKMHKGETVEITGNNDLALGLNVVTVTVTSEDGLHTTTYTFNVERTIRNNNYLSELWVEDESITPVFNPNISNYKLTVAYETTAVIIHATAEDKNATVEGTGMKTLLVGPNTFTVRVRAENGEVREYRVIVTRLGSPNNYLSSLIVEGETYTPEFSKTVQNYALAVPYETDSIKIIATAEDEDATIIGNGTVNLKQGINNIEVYVTAANGDVRTYVIKVTRKDPITAKLLNIEVENYELDPEFTPDNPLYSVTVDYETTKLNFIVTKMDPYSTYEIIGNRNLKIGLNDVYINVTSSNRIDTFQYHVIVNRQSYSNTFLSSLTVSQGELTPTFVKTTLTYSVEVPNNVELITVDGSPDYPLSTVEGLGDYTLKVGMNQIKITVKSPSGIKRTYNVNVLRRKSSNANITSIRANIGTLEKNDDYTYTLFVPKYTKNIGAANFVVTTEDPAATVTMPTTIDLKQVQAYPIKVTSPDGTRTKEYTVNVVFDLSHDATLAMLQPSIGELNPVFDRLHNDYRIDLYDDEEEIYFDLYLNEVEATLLNRSLTYQLTELETLAEIMIQAEDGHINTYRVNIVKSKTKQQYLNNIEVTGVKEIDPDIVLPSFRSKTLDYELEVPYEVEHIGFDINKKHPAQAVKIYKNNVLQSGSEYSLDVGLNTFKIEVTNSIGEVTNYTYEITRLRSTNANLIELGLSTPNIVFTNFDKNVLTYSTQVGHANENVVVRAIPEVEGSRVTINGATYLEEGIEREITVTVTAMDGVTKKTYTINVIRIPEVDNLIKTITVSDRGKIKPLNPVFRSGNTDYSITVSSATDSISIDAIPNNPLTVITGNKPITTSEFGNTTTYKMEPSLVTGNNLLEFYSTADFEGNSYVKTYKIMVNRVTSQNALLEKLEVKNGVMVEEFEKNKEDYTVNVANDVTSLNLLVVTEDSEATYVVNGNQELGYGKENVVEIVVTSADGSVSKHYRLHVNVKGESNNYLSDLRVDDESIQNFDKYLEEYELTVEYANEAIDIVGIPEKSTATVENNGRHALSVGENDINIVVYAQDGTPKTYTIHVTREDDAYLSNIVYTLKNSDDDEGRSSYLEGFNRQIYEYELIVENEVEKINVIALADDIINATITGQAEYDLKVGDNPINLVVKNGNTRKVYKINVKRKGSSNTNLVYLTSTDGPLIPEFTNDNDEYEIHIPNYKTKLALSYEVEHNATVQIVDNELSGTESTVKVIVTAEDGTQRTISILVHLEDGGYFNSRLANLEVTEGTISPRFDPDTYSYSVTVSQDYENVHIIAIPEEDTSMVMGDGVQSLILGRNEKQVVVTAQDGTTTTYTIVIFRKDAANADLTGLYTDIGELDPAFSPKTYNYRIEVPEETRKVHLTAVAYSEKTIVGDGDVYLGKGETVRNIIVTSESGITNTYIVTINRALSTNHDITNITESTGKMNPTYDPLTEEYAYSVGDRSTLNNTYVIADKITFNVTTFSELAEVLYQKEGEEETTNNVVPLEYGDNVIYIYARSEDGNESTHYKFTIHRIHDLTDIVVPGDSTGPPNPIDGSPNHISVQPGGTFDLLSEITYNPEDADFKDLIFKSNNTNFVTITSDGIITAADVLDKSTTITVTSKYYPSVVKTVNVTVEITLITSDVYDIQREHTGYDPYVTYIELQTTIDDFLNGLNNDRRFLYLYDPQGNRITDYTQYVGTGMRIQLENNGHVYDGLDIVVIGDLNTDGYCNATDVSIADRVALRRENAVGVYFLAGDVNKDGYINATDVSLADKKALRKIDSLLD